MEKKTLRIHVKLHKLLETHQKRINLATLLGGEHVWLEILQAYGLPVIGLNQLNSIKIVFTFVVIVVSLARCELISTRD